MDQLRGLTWFLTWKNDNLVHTVPYVKEMSVNKWSRKLKTFEL